MNWPLEFEYLHSQRTVQTSALLAGLRDMVSEPMNAGKDIVQITARLRVKPSLVAWIGLQGFFEPEYVDTEVDTAKVASFLIVFFFFLLS